MHQGRKGEKQGDQNQPPAERATRDMGHETDWYDAIVIVQGRRHQSRHRQ